MQRWSVPKASIIPALILAAIVISTFLILRDYGPESTVRQFHATLHKIYTAQQQKKPIPMKDWNELRRLLIEDIGDPNLQSGDFRARELLSFAYRQFSMGSTYSLAKMDRYPREVRSAVVYNMPNGQQRAFVWVVVKGSGTRQWKISAAKTYQAQF